MTGSSIPRKKPVLPNFIIAGAPKCGTSSVHQWLTAHPQAAGSVPKETGYFVDPGSHIHDPARHIANGLEGYCRFFNVPGGSPPKVTFESTPAYLYHRTALKLADLSTCPRFLFILREPSAQIYSLFSYYRNNWDHVPADMEFAAFCAAARKRTEGLGGNELCRNAIAYADYRPHLMRWRDRVGPDRMKIMLFEDLRDDPKFFMQALCRWLGIDAAFYETYSFPRTNETYAVRSHALQRATLGTRPILAQLGPLYRVLRSLYRLANAERPKGPTLAEAHVMQQLKLEFGPANARLAQEFNLELSSWLQPNQAES